jgi:hypothetical protein
VVVVLWVLLTASLAFNETILSPRRNRRLDYGGSLAVMLGRRRADDSVSKAISRLIRADGAAWRMHPSMHRRLLLRRRGYAPPSLCKPAASTRGRGAGDVPATDA